MGLVCLHLPREMVLGWYTSNTKDTFSWKYGDVVKLARESRLGELKLIPRFQALDEDGESFDGEEFLGCLQHWATVKRKLPWKQPIEFDPRDKHHESVVVPYTVNIGATLSKWARNLRRNRKSLLAAVAHYNEIDEKEIGAVVAEASITTDVSWYVAKASYPDLVAWLNRGLARSKGPAFELAALKAGHLTTSGSSREYHPTDSILAALDALPKKDESRVLATYALGHALVERSRFELIMPDDEFQEDVWGAEAD